MWGTDVNCSKLTGGCSLSSNPYREGRTSVPTRTLGGLSALAPNLACVPCLSPAGAGSRHAPHLRAHANKGQQCCAAGTGRRGPLFPPAAGLPAARVPLPPMPILASSRRPWCVASLTLQEPARSGPPWRPEQPCSPKSLNCNNPDLSLFFSQPDR